jgi:PTH1 family peptidyl-tRNA hydrolase
MEIMFYIVGLGNHGEKYQNTRHNVGWIVCDYVREKARLPALAPDNSMSGRVTEGMIAGAEVKMLYPDTYMNNSGSAVVKFVPKNAVEYLIVIHDDIDLPLGTMKISYNKGTGGHRGLDSVAKVVKTLEFVRVRIGISPATAKGRAKKPEGEQKVLDFILGKFKPSETDILKKTLKGASEAVQTLISDGRERAMNMFN